MSDLNKFIRDEELKRTSNANLNPEVKTSTPEKPEIKYKITPDFLMNNYMRYKKITREQLVKEMTDHTFDTNVFTVLNRQYIYMGEGEAPEGKIRLEELRSVIICTCGKC